MKEKYIKFEIGMRVSIAALLFLACFCIAATVFHPHWLKLRVASVQETTP